MGYKRGDIVEIDKTTAKKLHLKDRVGFITNIKNIRLTFPFFIEINISKDGDEYVDNLPFTAKEVCLSNMPLADNLKEKREEGYENGTYTR